MYNIIQLNDKDLSELQIIAKELGIKKTDSHIPGRGKKESFFGIPCQHQAGQM